MMQMMKKVWVQKTLFIATIIIIVATFLMISGCSDSSKKQDSVGSTDRVEQQAKERASAAQKSREEQARKEQQANLEKQRNQKNAQEAASKFITLLFDEQYAEMGKYVYCLHDDKARIQTEIDAMELNAARLRGYLNYKAKKLGKSNANLMSSVKVTDLQGTTAHFRLDLQVDNQTVVFVDQIEMAQDKNGQWRVNTSSFNERAWNKMDEMDTLRNFE